jgi:hypothetical protein
MILAIIMTVFAQAAQFETWPDYSAPSKVPMKMEYKFESLPLEGRHTKLNTGWSDDYWPSQKGSINRRWNAPGEPGFKLISPSKEKALKMSENELAQLSPSEKYDLYRGLYEYPLVNAVKGIATPRARDWSGICHGWAPASLIYSEPGPVSLSNPDGIIVPFGASDVKALLSYFYAFYVEQQTFQIGLRCFLGRGIGGLQRGCNQDLNAGALHVIISNRLGIMNEGFIADVDRYKEVWNQPVIGYQSKIIKRGIRPTSSADESAVEIIHVKTTFIYADETAPQWERVIGTENEKTDSLNLEYNVEINAQGEIVGGEWISDSRPDFLWFRSKAEFSDEFKKLENIYQASILE